MSDRYDHDLLLAYLEDELAPGDRARVEAMLADDPRLGALMRDMAGDRALLRSLPSEPAPGDLSFDLVQGLERRMLLDAPEVDSPGTSGGPIPISRGRRDPRAAGGVRWSRVVGVGGMAAALGLAAGLVLWFNQTDPLSRTAFEMADHPAGNAQPTPAARGESGEANGDGVMAEAPGANTPGTTPRAGRSGGPGTATPGRPDMTLAERARDAMLNGGGGRGAHAGNPPTVPTPPPSALAAGAGRPASAGEPVLALTAYAPDRALRIASDNPGLSREQVVQWCVDNGVPVVEPDVPVGFNGGDFAQDSPEQLALLIEEDQLEQLIHAVNRIEHAPRLNQRAEIGAVEDAVYGDAALVQNLAALEESADTAPESDAAEGHDPRVGPEAQADAAAADDAGVDADAPVQQVVALKVPDDLGDEFLNRQNVANTYVFTNQDELARAAQREAEVLRNQRRQALPGGRDDDRQALAEPAAPAPGAALLDQAGSHGGAAGAEAPEQADPQDEEHRPADGAERGVPGRAESRGGGSRAGGLADQQRERSAEPNQGPGTGDPAADSEAEEGEHQQTPPPIPDGGRDPAPADGVDDAPGNAEGATDHHDNAAPPREADTTAEHGQAEPPAPRGNWLMPQMPLADSAPVLTEPPSARLVPVVFILQHLRPDAGEAADAAVVEVEAAEDEDDETDAGPGVDGPAEE